MYTFILDRSGNIIDNQIKRDTDGAVIPQDENNYDWKAYLEYRANGGVPTNPKKPTLAAIVSADLK